MFIRDDVKTGNEPCYVCKKLTRSHILEPALYEEYVVEVVVDQSDDFANKQWEDTEEVIKMRKAKNAVTCCHICWQKRREEITEILERDYEKWESDPRNHLSRIQVVAEICQTYNFENESKKMRYLISMMKESTG